MVRPFPFAPAQNRMLRMSSLLRRCALAAVLVPLLPALAVAQPTPPNRPAISLSGGVRMYERTDATASAVSVAIRSELPIAEIFVLELAGSVADVPEGIASGTTSVIESQLQLAIPLGDVLTPYGGAGVGMAKIERFDEEEDGWQAVFSAAVGVRAAFSGNLGLVADARIRGRGSQLASHIDMTVGLRYAFGRPDRPRFRGGRQ